MASLVLVLVLIAIIAGACIGAFIKISLAIRREDRMRTLRFDAPDRSAETARAVVGVNGSRWE